MSLPVKVKDRVSNMYSLKHWTTIEFNSILSEYYGHQSQCSEILNIKFTSLVTLIGSKFIVFNLGNFVFPH